MAKKDELPQDLVDRIAREENEQDRELVAKPLRAAKDKVMEVVGPAWQKAFDKKAEKEAAEKKTAKENREAAGKAAVKGMQEGRMDAMGNVYKKGGKVRGCGIARKGLTKGRMV
jgi:CO dehydrogenase/acetyl-CoA synthase beta subunit